LEAGPVISGGKKICTLFFATLLLGACGRAGGGTGSTTRFDSAGVAIVTNTGPDRSVLTTMDVAYRLGGEDSGPESFYQIYPSQVGVGEQGEIAVLNRQAYEVSTFDADGRFLATYGRHGAGPGELRLPSSVAVTPAGEVIVYDLGKQALVPFAGDGTTLDERRLSVPFDGVDMVATPTGIVLLSRSRHTKAGTSISRVLHLTPSDTVQLGPSAESSDKVVTYESCGVSIWQPPLFAPDLVWGSNGMRTAVAAGPSYTIWVYDDTTAVEVIRRDMEPEPVTRDVATREVGDGERWNIGGRECLVPADEVLDQRGYVATVPLVEAITVTPSGDLWVKRRRPGTQEHAVDIFDAGGGYVGTASPTPPFPVRFLPDGRALTVEKDAFDVQVLAVYRVTVGGA
jgi:hypothetical protein